MLRVCGITYDHTLNYGSSLQAYALQKAIEGMYINGEPCRYELIPFLKFKDDPRCRKKTARQSISSTILSFYKIPFKGFEKKKIHYAKCSTTSDLVKLNESFDVFVCGSDVIWSPQFNLNHSAYYLDFAKKYHFSYAASFGKTEYVAEVLKNKSDLFARFNQISLREKSTITIVEQFVNCPVRWVIDPTLLLKKEEWNQLVRHKRKKEYIFVYTTYQENNLERFVQAISKLTGLPIVRTYNLTRLKQAVANKTIMLKSPQEWIQLIRDAEFVVTNSFHGTVFSTIFHKRLFAFVQGEKDKGGNFRLYEYLNEIGLGDRLYNKMPESINLGDIDYREADERICSMREESLKFIRENLEAAAKQRSNGK